MLAAIPSMGQRCVSVLLDRVREVTRMEQQAEKLNALGKLAANLAHELNNPASAAQRSASGLFGDLREYGEQMFHLGALSRDVSNSEELGDWVERTRERLRASSPQGRPSAILADLGDSRRDDAALARSAPDPRALDARTHPRRERYRLRSARRARRHQPGLRPFPCL